MNFHPPLSSFPVALISITALLEVWSMLGGPASLRAAIRVNWGLMIIAVAAAFFSGYQASELANQTFTVSDDVISQHHQAGRLLLFLVVPCAALGWLGERAKFNRMVFRGLYGIFLAVCTALVLYTGFLGGELVFRHGAGVFATPQDSK